MRTRIVPELLPSTLLAPERYVGTRTGAGVPLGDLVVERALRVRKPPADAIVFDTTHARDGLLDLACASRAPGVPASAKKPLIAGDLLVSRLRTYLRQVAWVHPLIVAAAGRPLACSTEFHVLSPRDDGASLAFLVPFVLSAPVQARLLAAQEGGHHPRVPRDVLLSLPVPRAWVRRREELSRRVTEALGALLVARGRWYATLEG